MLALVGVGLPELIGDGRDVFLRLAGNMQDAIVFLDDKHRLRRRKLFTQFFKIDFRDIVIGGQGQALGDFPVQVLQENSQLITAAFGNLAVGHKTENQLCQDGNAQHGKQYLCA